MRLYEHQAKKLLALHHIPTPRGVLATGPAEAESAARQLGLPVAIKAQVLAGGRGRAGGIRLAQPADQVATITSEILASRFSGLAPCSVLIEEAVQIRQELYLSFALDRERCGTTLISSATGGVNVEETTQLGRKGIVQVSPDPYLGVRAYHARELAAGIGLPQELHAAFCDLVRNLYDCALSCDASLAEINPLAITTQGQLVALDAKMILDDNALYRHPELAKLQDSEEESQERAAREHGLNYVKLQGEIGCMVNGAGLAMATMDLIRQCGGAPANFLDIGGGASAERVSAALRIILSDAAVRAVLINIFGGITRCDQVAQGLLSVLGALDPKSPIVVRLVGTNAEEGQRLLSQAAVITARSLSEAAQKAVLAAHSPTQGGAA